MPVEVKAECERVIAMHEEQAVSDNDYDKAVSGLERISAKLKNHQDQLEDCSLVAPYDGYVGKIFRAAGESVAPGLPVMSLFTSGDTEVVISVPESEYREIQKSADYEATFSALPGRRFPLKLKSSARKASGNQLYQLRFSLADKSADILPGMGAMVYIQHKSAEYVGGEWRRIRDFEACPAGMRVFIEKDAFSLGCTAIETPRCQLFFKRWILDEIFCKRHEGEKN